MRSGEPEASICARPSKRLGRAAEVEGVVAEMTDDHVDLGASFDMRRAEVDRWASARSNTLIRRPIAAVLRGVALPAGRSARPIDVATNSGRHRHFGANRPVDRARAAGLGRPAEQCRTGKACCE